MTNATAGKVCEIGQSAAKTLPFPLSTGMMRKVQRLAERRRAKRPEMRGLYVPAVSRPLAVRFAEKIEPQPNGCHNWISCIMPNGYGQIRAGGRAAYAHRVAWELANGPIPKGAYVLHSCDNRRCVNVAHLRLGSFQDNMDDMTARLRHAHGAKNGHAKLTVAEVRKIRRAVGSQPEIAARFGVTQPLVSMIKTRRIWRYV